MEKLQYLLWPPGGRAPEDLRKELLDGVAPRLLDLGARGLAMNIADEHAAVPPPVAPPEGEAPVGATVSIWLDCLDSRGPFEELLRGASERLAGYLVTESLYTDYGDNSFAPPRSWPDGERSPGLSVVTLLEKPDRLSYAEWVAHWHGVQSPVSAAMQPRTRYVRNAVARSVTAEAPPYLGIVEECWPSADHVTDPMLFYCAEGSKETLRRNIERMLESVTAFLDLDRIRTMTMSEYLLRSWSADG
jgi:hypothetical protein